MDTNNQTQPENNFQGKKNNKITPVIIAVIVLLLLGWYFVKNRGDFSKVKSTNENSDKLQTENNQNSPISLKELMAGKPQRCEVLFSEDQNSKTQGTVYVSKGMVRADFTVESEGKRQVMHMINNGEIYYTWVDGNPQMAFKMSAKQPSDKSSAQSPTIDFDVKDNYKCESWGGGESGKFEPPSDVKFKDYTEMMKSIPQAPPASSEPSSANPGDLKAIQCSACDNLSGEQKTQCKAALSCK